MVSKNWIDEVTRWLEIGIVIYNPTYWHGGIGGRVLKIWISEIFDQYPELEHIGLTTWSGNSRMIHLAQKLGFKKEAQIRKVRFYKEKKAKRYKRWNIFDFFACHHSHSSIFRSILIKLPIGVLHPLFFKFCYL